MTYHASRSLLPALCLLLGIVSVSGCKKDADPATAAGAAGSGPGMDINKPGGAVDAPPEVKTQIHAAEQAESAKRAARAGQPK